MLDLGLTKMALIGVVALVVLGPERLPRVARTAGALFGRAQRYINDVMAEVTHEIELDELRRMKTQLESAASNVENTIHNNLRKHETELDDAWNAGTSATPSIAGGAVEGREGSASGASWRSSSAPAPKRKNWRVKQTAMPAWYKRATTRPTRVQSGAARVARHTPATLRRSTRFF
ncbi:Sec-independent protein translocase protein TatB [Paraburkholderia elongata]|uniref:Sec-independent protein translocase protein TatB n=1 Tax=Paraburkholderia elongata TaxID=2675747 RepID=A0A972NKH2_9BURK|nr:Sec-independent protein translocase protein TatB [Paraburkholderia elongata]NPT55026.1 Sec-independent protein translocase subunit TatB [Paraburkholderia elongata]